MSCIYRCFVPQNSCKNTDPRPGEVRALPVSAFRSGDSSGEESCAICLDEFAEGDCIKLLPKCEHIFHKECIDEWLLSHSSLCPVCRDRAVERNPETAKRCTNADPVFIAFNIPSFGRGIM